MTTAAGVPRLFPFGIPKAGALKFDPWFGVIERVLDCLAVLCGLVLAHELSGILKPITRSRSYPAGWLAAFAFSIFFVLLLDRHGEYRPYVSLMWVRETERLLRVTLQSFVAASLVAFCTTIALSRLDLGLTALTVPVLLTLEKWGTHKSISRLRSKGYGTRKALILGTGSLGRQILSALSRSPEFGLDPVGFVDDDPHEWGREIYACSYYRKSPTRVLTGALSPELLRQAGASVLVIAVQDMDQTAMLRIVELFSAEGISTYFVPAESFRTGARIEYAEIDGITLGHTLEESTRVFYETGKRLLDIVLAIAALAIAALPCGLIALLIKISSPGPVFFSQQRVGRNGKTFSIYKFRSMFTDADVYAYSPFDAEDPRITPIGRFLRRTSADELPQLLNVLRGNMSLVGPRPEMPFIAEGYSPELRERLKVKPGIIGLWQMSADRAFLIHQSIEYDLYYLINNPRFIGQACLQLSGLRTFEIRR